MSLYVESQLFAFHVFFEGVYLAIFISVSTANDPLGLWYIENISDVKFNKYVRALILIIDFLYSPACS